MSDVVDGVTAAVLNRPERPDAAAGAPSRGVLPLLAAQYRDHWPEHVDLTAMASFNLVLAAPEALVWWRFDGRRLDRQDLTAGTFLFTPRSLRIEGLDPRFAAGEARLGENLAAPAERVWPEWLAVLAESVPSDDPSSLIVHLPRGKDIYETVFGQLIAARPGVLRLDYLIRPALGTDRRWTTELWRADRLDEATVSRDSQADVRPSRTIRSHPESVST